MFLSLYFQAYSSWRQNDPIGTPPPPAYVVLVWPVAVSDGRSSSRGLVPAGAPTIEYDGEDSPK